VKKNQISYSLIIRQLLQRERALALGCLFVRRNFTDDLKAEFTFFFFKEESGGLEEKFSVRFAPDTSKEPQEEPQSQPCCSSPL
jgi:hypothetical protein